MRGIPTNVLQFVLLTFPVMNVEPKQNNVISRIYEHFGVFARAPLANENCSAFSVEFADYKLNWINIYSITLALIR